FGRFLFSTATRYPASRLKIGTALYFASGDATQRRPKRRSGSGLDDAREVWRHAVGAHRRDRDGRVGGLHHLAVPDKQCDALAAFGAIENQVAGQRLRWRDLAADLVLVARRSRHLDPDPGEGVQHQTRRVEADPADTGVDDSADERAEAREADVARHWSGGKVGVCG